MCSTAFSQDAALTAEEKKELLAASPFNSVYPESILKSANTYFNAQMGLYKEGAMLKRKHIWSPLEPLQQLNANTASPIIFLN